MMGTVCMEQAGSMKSEIASRLLIENSCGGEMAVEARQR